MFDEKKIRLNFYRGIFKFTKIFKKTYEPNIIKLISSFIPQKIINKKISSLLDFKATTGIDHTTIILEYFKRFENKVYLLFERNTEINNMYYSILSMLKWSISDIPYKNSEILIHLISEYINLIEESNQITEENITHCRYILQKLCFDSEAFLGSIYYIFHSPQWVINHKFIVEYVQTRIGQSYYFT